MARAIPASRELFSGVSSQVQYGRVVRCDKLNAVGATTGPERGVGICVGEMGKANGRSSVAPDNLGQDSSLRMTGCARARGDRDTLCVDLGIARVYVSGWIAARFRWSCLFEIANTGKYTVSGNY